MKQLIDTHTLLWFTMGNPRISDNLRLQIENNDNLLSIASVWEMAIKQSQSKLDLKKSAADYVEEKISFDDFELLPIQLHHLRLISTLPFYHRDPFDRLLIAQSITEQVPILSKDKAFDQYSVARIWNNNSIN